MTTSYSLVTFEAKFHYAGTRLLEDAIESVMWVNRPPLYQVNDFSVAHLTEDAISVRAIAPRESAMGHSIASAGWNTIFEDEAEIWQMVSNLIIDEFKRRQADDSFMREISLVTLWQHRGEEYWGYAGKEYDEVIEMVGVIGDDELEKLAEMINTKEKP